MPFDDLMTSVRDSRLPSPAVRRQIREEARVTIREAAKANGVAPMTYLRWERGEAQPRRQHAIEYRRFLDALGAVPS
jgi:transcriptional regulator with XRE-family HTH domain